MFGLAALNNNLTAKERQEHLKYYVSYFPTIRLQQKNHQCANGGRRGHGSDEPDCAQCKACALPVSVCVNVFEFWLMLLFSFVIVVDDIGLRRIAHLTACCCATHF